jgi:hypothetical protein
MKFRTAIMFLVMALTIVGCQPKDKLKGDAAPASDAVVEMKAEAPQPMPIEALNSAIAECRKDEACMAHMQAAELGSCAWYDYPLCAVGIAAVTAACVVTEGAACEEALEALVAIASVCCDCLPDGKVKDMCKAL